MRKITNNQLKYVILIRHGDLNNPRNIVYNRDSAMKKNDIIHLSQLGRQQLEALAKVIQKKLNLVIIFTSPETRTIESTQIIAKRFKLRSKQTAVSADLDDVDAPGAYLEKLSMTEWRKLDGNAYDQDRWNKYYHERPKQIIKRMEKIFWKAAKKLSGGQAAALISHGDPISWFVNYLLTKKIPPAHQLRHLIYPKKAEAIVFIINDKNNVLDYYQLTDPTLKQGSIY